MNSLKLFLKENKLLILPLILLSILITYVSLSGLIFNLQKRASGQAVQLSLISDKTDLRPKDTATLSLSALFSVVPTQNLDYAHITVYFPMEFVQIESIDTSSSGLNRKIYVDSIEKANQAGSVIIEIGADKGGAGPSTSTVATLAKIGVRFKTAGVGQFVIDQDSQLVINKSSQKLAVTPLSLNLTVVENTPTPEPTATVGAGTPTPTVTPTCTDGVCVTPTPITSGTETETTFRFKLQGVNSLPKNNSPQKFSLSLSHSSLSDPIVFNADFSPNSEGIYESKIISSQIPILDGYTLLVKGPKHLARRFCSALPSSTDGFTYKCEAGAINIKNGKNYLDFSTVPLLAGDLPPQDGLLNAADIKILMDNLFKETETALNAADLNYDNAVNGVDLGLLLVNMNAVYEEDK